MISCFLFHKWFITHDKPQNNIPHSGFLSREKTLANCFKIDFRGENFREFAVTQCTTPTSAVSNCLKIYFRGENFRESPQKREIRESFLLRKKPVIRYICYVFIHVTM